MKKTAMMTMAVAGLMMVGCTYPTYSRTVTQNYDANGKLTGTVVTEHVTQMDPNSKPLMGVLKHQTYQK